MSTVQPREEGGILHGLVIMHDQLGRLIGSNESAALLLGYSIRLQPTLCAE